MEKMINLKDLLKHEVQDLYSAEEQIIDALPAMIDKAENKQLKKALQDHLAVTRKQKERLDEVRGLLNEEEEDENQSKGFFSKLFGGGAHKCKGMEGVITEGEKIMGEDMTPAVMDAAIIACAQKVEHYEICGYGTARAYARELNLGNVAELLEETLNEEYEADDLLTDLAVGRLNEKAENGEMNSKSNGRSAKSGGGVGVKNNVKSNRSVAKKSAPASKKNAPNKSASKKSVSKKSVSKKSASKGRSSRTSKKGR